MKRCLKINIDDAGLGTLLEAARQWSKRNGPPPGDDALAWGKALVGICREFLDRPVTETTKP